MCSSVSGLTVVTLDFEVERDQDSDGMLTLTLVSYRWLAKVLSDHCVLFTETVRRFVARIQNWCVAGSCILYVVML